MLSVLDHRASSLFLVFLFFLFFFFFFNDTATTEIYTLSLHDALPISSLKWLETNNLFNNLIQRNRLLKRRSEERFSRNAETDLVCRLLLEKKKKKRKKKK